MQGLDEKQLKDILERAVGAGRAAVALEAFRQPSSVSVRINPFKPAAFPGSREVFQAGRVPGKP